jgi:hypothetical protein
LYRLTPAWEAAAVIKPASLFSCPATNALMWGLPSLGNAMSTATTPLRDGFRRRGAQVTRLETFVDAAFAFAVTLLVIAVGKMPESYTELADALRRVPTFFICFTLLAGVWLAHERHSRRFGLEDRITELLSLALVAVVLVFVYPLRMVISSGLAFLTRGWVPTDLTLHSVAELETAFRIFGVGYGSVSLILMALNAHALRQAQALALDAHEQLGTRHEVLSHAIAFGHAVLCIALTYVVADSSSPWWQSLPGFSFALMGVSRGLLGWYIGRQRPQPM